MARREYLVLLSLMLSWHEIHCLIDPKSYLATKVPKYISQNEDLDLKDVLSIYLPMNADPGSACGKAVQQMYDDLQTYDGTHPTWTHKMVDSWQKSYIGGRLMGDSFTYGDFSECIYTTSPNKSIHGKYIYITAWKYGEEKSETPDLHKIANVNTPQIQNAITGVMNQANNSLFVFFTCIPDVCSDEEYLNSMAEVMEKLRFVVIYSSSQVEEKAPLSDGDIGFLGVISLLGFLVILASAVEFYIEVTKNEKLSKGPLMYLLPFSAYTNLPKIFHMSPKRTPGTISCLNAMRVLSMTWVIYGHQYTVYLDSQSNFWLIWVKVTSLPFQIIANGFLSVDSFFFMSGLLVCYNILKELKRSGRFNILLYYIHRLIRLLPPIAIISGLFATVGGFFVEGPHAQSWYYWEYTCQKALWRDMLLITNIVTDPIEEGFGPSCLPHTWYLGADFQLYVFAPFIVLPLFYFSPLGEAWLFIMALVTCIIPAAITSKYDLPPTAIMPESSPEFMERIYNVPWARAGPYVIGIAFGYLLHKQGKSKIKLQSWQVVSGWTAAAFAGLMVIFKLWDYNIPTPRVWPYDQATQVMYAGFHRSIWGLALGWVVFACHNGYGGVVDDFLSHPIWQPMSRMTFTIYLIAFPLQYGISYCTMTMNYFTHYNKLIETVGALVASTLIATVVTLLVESPIIGLEKLLLRSQVSRGPSRQKSQGVDNAAFSQASEYETKLEFNSIHMEEKNAINLTGIHQYGESVPLEEFVETNETKTVRL